MSPSVREKCRSGKRLKASHHMRSANVRMEETGERVMATLGGASAEVWNVRDEEPTWQQRTVPSSAAAANRGSHALEWMLGIPSASGFSENVTA
jgi:precorrin-6x reductase